MLEMREQPDKYIEIIEAPDKSKFPYPVFLVGAKRIRLSFTFPEGWTGPKFLILFIALIARWLQPDGAHVKE